MRILIVDDEAPARARLRALVDELGNPYRVVGEAADGVEALTRCGEGDVDLVLMDIRMPRLDGLDCATELAALPTPPAVIFVTAYERHALEAFDRDAVDYLLKPVRRERLQRALERAGSPTLPQLRALEALRGESAGEGEFITIRARGGLRRIPLNQILYFQADQKYVTLRHLHGEELLEDSLKSLEGRYAERLLRIHRNALVAKRFLRALERGGEHQFYVRLAGCDERLEVSRRHLAEVRSWLEGEAAEG
jgi:two-component system, LytTR family, response regulator AlgR